MRKFLSLILCVGFLLVSTSTLSSAASDSLSIPFFMPCKTEQDVKCITGITAELPDGRNIKGELTGLVVNDKLSETDSYLKYLVGPKVEWNFPGLTFSNGNGKAVMYAYYWPAGDVHCWNDGNCDPNSEELGFYFRPSVSSGWRAPVILTGKDAQLVCPSNPTNCNLGSPPWLFNTDAKFHFQFRMPSSFKAIYTQGRVKNLSIQKLVSDDASISNNYSNYDVTFSPLALENVAFTLPDISVFNQGLYTSDEPAVWISGEQNGKTTSLGECGKSGGLSVVTNAFYMWNPEWDSENQSIKVKLQASHLATDGTPNVGYLEVRIPTQMASCMWKVNLNNEITAKVSLTYTDGSAPEIITVTGKLDGQDYLMTSAGFHFSTPTLNIKLIGNNQQKEIPPSSPSAAPTIRRITCIKGKIVKKLILSIPKCPTGYKLTKPS